MSYYVMLKCCWALLVSFPCSSWCKVCPNLQKTVRPSYAILQLLSSWLILQAHYYKHILATLNLGVSSTFGGPILNPIIPNELYSFLKSTMQNHCQATMLPPHDYNPTTRLWERINFSAILNHHMSQWFVLTKMSMSMGNVEDKHIFSNLAFIKSKLQN